MFEGMDIDKKQHKAEEEIPKMSLCFSPLTD